MGEQRLNDVMGMLVKAFREGKTLSDELMRIFGDDGGMINVYGWIMDAMILACGEENTDMAKTLVYRIATSQLNEKASGKMIARMIRRENERGNLE